MTSTFLALIGSALAGGALAAILQWQIGRRKAPAEIGNLIVQSAEMTTQQALELAAAHKRRADDAEAREAVLRNRLDSALERVEVLLTEVAEMRRELQAIKEGRP